MAVVLLAGCDDGGGGGGGDGGATDSDHFPGSTGPRTLVCSDPTGTHNQDDDGDGFSECEGDCNDGDVEFYPGAPDVDGDQIDNGCDNYTPTKT